MVSRARGKSLADIALLGDLDPRDPDPAAQLEIALSAIKLDELLTWMVR